MRVSHGNRKAVCDIRGKGMHVQERGKEGQRLMGVVTTGK